MQNQLNFIKCSLFGCAIFLCANSRALPPVITTQPENASVIEGSNVTFQVELRDPQLVVPVVTSGNLRLWLKADAGAVIDGSNRVSQWQDFSGLTNHCFQTNANKQPLLITNGFNGKAAIRFDGIQDANSGDFLQGTGNVGLTNGFTSFMVYTKANRSVPEEGPVLIGVPSVLNSVRAFYIRGIAGISNEMAFSGWANDYGSGFRIPVLTPRIWSQRLNATKSKFEFFDTDGATNFTISRATSGLLSPGNGYYVGGLGSEKRNFQGDIAEIIYYQGALSDLDRVLIEDYLREKHLSSPGSNFVNYQWRFNGTNIIGATNSFLHLDNVQLTDAGSYSVVISNFSGSALSSNAFLTVLPANHAPVAFSKSYSVDEDSGLPITLVATDPDEDALLYTVTPPAHGTLTGTAPNLVYQPNANFYGTDSFTFNANDGKTNSAEAIISIDIAPVNDAPAAFSQFLSVNEDNSLSLTLTATDVEGNALTYNVTPPANGTLSGAAPHLIYQPNANFHGNDGFAFTVNDGQLDSQTATINIEVISVNDAPVAMNLASPSFLFSSNEISTVVIAPCDEDAVVTLDASSSYDIESDPLEYFWIEGTNVLTSGEIASNSFPVGTHSLLLAVSDGVDSGFANLQLEVITPAQAVAELVIFVENSTLPKNRKQTLLASLNAAVASLTRCQIIPGLNQLKAFQHKVEAEITPLDPALANELFHISDELIAAIK